MNNYAGRFVMVALILFVASFFSPINAKGGKVISHKIVALSSPTPLASPSCTGTGKTWRSLKDDMLEMCVPEGKFVMGSSPKELDQAMKKCKFCNIDQLKSEAPRHLLQLDAFWMDKTEITNGMYGKCVQAGKCEKPGCKYYDLPKYAKHPAVCVTWQQAQDYCQWAGGHLPTEAEWEKAARGTEGRIYPWGGDSSQAKANYWGSPGYCSNTIKPVGSYLSGASPYGVLDMAGNVAEWTQDWYNANYYQDSPVLNPQGAQKGKERVLRGGAYCFSDNDIRSARRAYSEPNVRFDIVGFRCVRNP